MSDYKEKYLLLTQQYSRDIDEFIDLVSLVKKDLRMRASDAGVVNISGFIWDKINEIDERYNDEPQQG